MLESTQKNIISVDYSNPLTLIIAEIGVNHNGSAALAKEMIRKVALSGAQCAKFQSFKADSLATSYAQKADYQKTKTAGQHDNQLLMLKSLELGADTWSELKKTCDELHVEFMSSPFDISSVAAVCELGVKRLKIPSGEITNLPFLQKVAAAKLPTILSTGMATLSEIEAALVVLEDAGLPLSYLTLLHCNSEYPTPFIDVHLRVLETLKLAFGTPVGYSDHTKGIEVAIAAVALGASVIEKHVTLDCSMPGPDHKASVEFDEFERMVSSIRNVEVALGRAQKKPSSSEAKNRPVVRKSIVAAAPIPKGTVFTAENLTTKRPGTGVSPMEWGKIIGRTSTREFAQDEQIEF